MDYPTAWKLVRETAMEDHDPRCSYAQTSGAILCDCAVIDHLEAKHKGWPQGYPMRTNAS